MFNGHAWANGLTIMYNEADDNSKETVTTLLCLMYSILVLVQNQLLGILVDQTHNYICSLAMTAILSLLEFVLVLMVSKRIKEVQI